MDSVTFGTVTVVDWEGIVITSKCHKRYEATSNPDGRPLP